MGIWLPEWRRGRVTGCTGLAAGFWYWTCIEGGGAAFRGVVAEEEALGATLGGAGACFLVPESKSMFSWMRLNKKRHKTKALAAWPNVGNTTVYIKSFIQCQTTEMVSYNSCGDMGE